MKKTFAVLTVLAMALVPAIAFAAAKAGSYAGVSSSTVDVYGGGSKVDKGKVSFAVSKAGKVTKFKISGQEMQCNAGAAEFPISVPSFKLNSSGKGSITYKDPMLGSLKLTMTVTSAGKASGTLRNPSMKTGLCRPDYPVKFTAKVK
jgi:hypothetical protein